MLHVVNCTSTCVNQTSESASQNGGNLRLTVATAGDAEELEVDGVDMLRRGHQCRGFINNN